jgi:large subunit ribosomal protein L17
MRHRKYTFKIGRTSEHRRAMVANAVCSLIRAGRITTTVQKAKGIQRLAERMVTLAKEGTLHARRQAIAALHQTGTVAELFSKLAPQYEGRTGGYTRIMRLGQRLGDAAEMCILELIPAAVVTPSEAVAPAADAAKAAPVTEAAAEEKAEAKTEEK